MNYINVFILIQFFLINKKNPPDANATEGFTHLLMNKIYSTITIRFKKTSSFSNILMI